MVTRKYLGRKQGGLRDREIERESEVTQDGGSGRPNYTCLSPPPHFSPSCRTLSLSLFFLVFFSFLVYFYFSFLFFLSTCFSRQSLPHIFSFSLRKATGAKWRTCTCLVMHAHHPTTRCVPAFPFSSAVFCVISCSPFVTQQKGKSVWPLTVTVTVTAIVISISIPIDTAKYKKNNGSYHPSSRPLLLLFFV